MTVQFVSSSCWLVQIALLDTGSKTAQTKVVLPYIPAPPRLTQECIYGLQGDADVGALAHVQVVDLAQKISDWRYKVGGGQDEGITIPRAQGGLWVPQVTLPMVSPLPIPCGLQTQLPL